MGIRDLSKILAPQYLSTASKDFIALLMIFLLLLLISFQMEAFEHMEDFLEAYEHLELDEIIIVSSLLSVFISIFAFRRWREMKNSLVKRNLADRELKQTNLELRHKTEELKCYNDQNDKLSKLTNILQVCKSKDEVFQFIRQGAEQLFQGTNGALYITKDSRNQLFKVTEWGKKEINRGFIAPDDCWGLRMGKRHTSSPDLDNPVCNHVAGQEDTVHICTPLTAYGEIIGLLHMGMADKKSNENGDASSSDIKQISGLFAEQISLAISNLALHDKLRDMAIKDPLTGLYNRQYLKETFERELNRAKRSQSQIGVVMIDLDHFKKINDTFGHAAGDLLLMEMGRLITDFFRMEDFCCRFGGEEFIVLLSEISKDDLTTRCEIFRRRISELNVFYQERPLGKITGSLGAAIFPDNGENFSQLLKSADEALYCAKKEGRNRVCLAADEKQRDSE
jgi:diguanylate cyclase (GGDEF)-like protein